MKEEEYIMKTNFEKEELGNVISKSEGDILGQERNKQGKKLYVCGLKENNMYNMIFLINPESTAFCSKINISIEESKVENGMRVLEILDMIIINKNTGEGSILMKYLFNYIESNKEIKKIEGTITDIDKDHFDRLEYFFKKHGFDVQFRLDDNGERIGGRIYKIIN